MKLKDIYGSNVAGKGPIIPAQTMGQMSGSSQYLPVKERDPKSIKLEDICHHLAFINRYSGATPVPNSVAEHTILVHRILVKIGALQFLQLQGLLHDAHEAYTGDITTPVQRACVTGLLSIQGRLDKAILKSLGLGSQPNSAPVTWAHEVYAADQQALSNEYYAWFYATAPESWGAAVLPRAQVIDCPIPLFNDKPAAARELFMLITTTLKALKVKAP